MCKEQTFVEREILSLDAAIIILWDIEPVDWTRNCPILGVGVKKQVNDIV